MKDLLPLAAATLLGGCAWAPGMSISDQNLVYDAAPRGKQPASSETSYNVVTITPSVIVEQERARAAVRRDDSGMVGPEDLAKYEYRVGPLDVLSFVVWDHPELTTPNVATAVLPSAGANPLAVGVPAPVAEGVGHRVSSDGTIFFPYLGEVQVGGLTLAEIRSKIAKGLVKYVRDPQVDVRVSAYRSQKVHVSGEVKQPGTFPLTDAPLTVAEAVSRVQISPEADLHRATLTRGSKTYRLDLSALLNKGDLSQNWLLKSGDILNIPDRSESKVFVMGEVEKTSVLPMSKGRLSLADSIGLAGGMSPLSADARRVLVVRGDNAKPDALLVYHLDFSSADALLLATRFELQPLDVVYVSTAEVARFNRVISQILPTIQTLYFSAVMARNVRGN